MKTDTVKTIYINDEEVTMDQANPLTDECSHGSQEPDSQYRAPKALSNYENDSLSMQALEQKRPATAQKINAYRLKRFSNLMNGKSDNA